MRPGRQTFFISLMTPPSCRQPLLRHEWMTGDHLPVWKMKYVSRFGGGVASLLLTATGSGKAQSQVGRRHARIEWGRDYVGFFHNSSYSCGVLSMSGWIFWPIGNQGPETCLTTELQWLKSPFLPFKWLQTMYILNIIPSVYLFVCLSVPIVCLFVCLSVPIFNMHRISYIHVYDAIIITRPERPKGAKDEVKQAQRP